MSQLPLIPPVDVPNARVVALAGILAGFQWPGSGSWERLTKKQQQTAVDAARRALEELAGS